MVDEVCISVFGSVVDCKDRDVFILFCAICSCIECQLSELICFEFC